MANKTSWTHVMEWSWGVISDHEQAKRCSANGAENNYFVINTRARSSAALPDGTLILVHDCMWHLPSTPTVLMVKSG